MDKNENNENKKRKIDARQHDHFNKEKEIAYTTFKRHPIMFEKLKNQPIMLVEKAKNHQLMFSKHTIKNF